MTYSLLYALWGTWYLLSPSGVLWLELQCCLKALGFGFLHSVNSVYHSFICLYSSKILLTITHSCLFCSFHPHEFANLNCFIFISSISLGSRHKGGYLICLSGSISKVANKLPYTFYRVLNGALFSVFKSLSRHHPSGHILSILKEPTQVPFPVGGSLWLLQDKEAFYISPQISSYTMFACTVFGKP